MKHTKPVMSTASADELVWIKARELGGRYVRSRNSIYVTLHGKVVFRVICVSELGPSKLWVIDDNVPADEVKPSY